jgi:late competence protein required for DNA uptake (superfamily II DNA/RNA helicase)
MKKYEYRCDRCMTIEERWILYADKPPNSIFCHNCDGVALRHSRPKSEEKVYEKKSREIQKFQVEIVAQERIDENHL